MSFALRSKCLLAALIVGLSAIAAGSSAHAAQPTVQYGPVPAWVEPVQADQTAQLSAPGSADEGRKILLFDHQSRTIAQKAESYEHFALQIMSNEGLKTSSQLVVDFDSDSQSVIFHYARVHRNGKVLNRLNPAEIRILQREQQLENNILNGRHSAVLIFSDLRIGDILEYSYTKKNSFPSGSEHLSYNAAFGFNQPAAHFFERLIVSPKREIQVREYRPDAEAPFEPVIQESDNAIEYRWDAKPRPAYPIETYTPAWYPAQPWTQLSDYKSWDEVASWARQNFDVAPGPKIRPLVNQWKQEGLSQEELIKKAIRFTQEEIRYVGIEIGSSRWIPASPSTVLERRYGDCKDKTTLLLALFRELGVYACPVLVNSTQGESLAQKLPSPSLFDHAIVRFEPEPGSLHWVDPTLTHQGNALDELRSGEYRWSLPLCPINQQLEYIPLPTSAQNLVQVEESFHVPPPGTSEESSLEVKTIYHGGSATAMRSMFSTHSQDDIRKYYLNSYQSIYGTVRESSQMEQSDNLDTNQLIVFGHYIISEIWKPTDNEKRLTVSPRIFSDMLNNTNLNERKSPLIWSHPYALDYRIEINFPRQFNIKDETIKAQSPAFDFEFQNTSLGNTNILHWTYTTTSDTVTPQNMAAHREAVEKAKTTSSFYFFHRPFQKGPNWPAWAAVALAGIAGTRGAWRALRYRQKGDWQEPQAVHRGAGGSFLLFLIGLRLLTVPVFRIYGLVQCRWIFSHQLWLTVYSSTEPMAGPGFAIWTALECIFQALFLPVTVATLVLFFLQKRAFRLIFPWVEYICVGYMVLEAFLALAALDQPTGFLRNLVGALISFALARWVQHSKRSACTFIYP